MFVLEEYSFGEIGYDDIFFIRDIRNSQMEVLRQSSRLSSSDQIKWYFGTVRPSYRNPRASCKLFKISFQGSMIGYGGLCYLDHVNRHGEVAFLVEKSRTEQSEVYSRDFATFLTFLKSYAKYHLDLNRIWTETFEFRRAHISVLEQCGFHLEGTLREKVIFRNVFHPSLIHSCLLNEESDLPALATSSNRERRVPIDWRGYFETRTVLVTGGAGLIGRALVEQLLPFVDRIVCVDLRPRPEKWASESKIEHLSMDANLLTSEQLVPFDIGVVFHLAATFERTAETPEFWSENYHHNVKLSHHLGSLYRQLPTVERVVFASSYLIYDSDHYAFEEPQDRAVTVGEQFLVKPRNICGAAKLLHETELDFLSTFNRFTVVYPRIFRVYGPGECGRLGGTVINRWINQLLDRPDDPLEVYGQEARFDYVFSDEVATGLLMIAASSHCGVVNLGRGEARSVEEVLALLKEHFPAMSCRYGENQSKYEACQADMTRFEEVTGWSPEIRLEEGLRRCVDAARHRQRGVQSSSG